MVSDSFDVKTRERKQITPRPMLHLVKQRHEASRDMSRDNHVTRGGKPMDGPLSDLRDRLVNMEVEDLLLSDGSYPSERMLLAMILDAIYGLQKRFDTATRPADDEPGSA